jgi:glycosyltransferase involved in cell wall biosynthesis
MDVWVLDGARLQGMNVGHWMPVDCTPLGGRDKRTLMSGPGRPIAMSQFGKAQLQEAGFAPLYVPHGIDAGVFAPLPDRDALRAELGLTDRFVTGIAAANQDPMRKGLSEQLTAWAVFARAHPDALLLVHSRAEAWQGVNLNSLLSNLGVSPAQVRFCDQYLLTAGLIGDAEVARWCGVLDVLSNCSFGEGFGLHPLEAQACGTPVIVTGASSMPELCGSGWKVRVDYLRDAYWNRGHDAWWIRPSPPEILRCYEKAYATWKSGKMGPLRKRARRFALQYDAGRVMGEFWEPALKELMADPVPGAVTAGA